MADSRPALTAALLMIMFMWWSYLVIGVVESAGMNMLNEGCSSYNVSSLANFNSNLNASFRAIGERVAAGERFATAEQLSGADPVYAMVQCREYMSAADCSACFRNASSQIRNCSRANGARVVFDGCFLRYERMDFYGEASRDANREFCTNQTTSLPKAAFEAVVQGLLSDLQVAAPRTPELYAAGRREVLLGEANASVYAIGQCVRTIDEIGCRECLQVAVRNLQRCPPNEAGRAVDSGCFMRYSDSPFFADNQTTNLEPLLRTESSKSKVGLIGGVAGGVSALLLMAVMFLWFYISKHSKKTSPKGDILGATELRGATVYSYKDLKSATKNFKEENKLGEGGFGDVYKGTLKNGKIVAVKKLLIGQNPRAKADFQSEVTLISNVHHRNLIRLLGCCSREPDQLLLVYEYMPNASLDRFLFPGPTPNNKAMLSWKQRFDIILGTAQGLAYLHEQFHVRIIHRDIKPSNILLDNDFHPKIADFGLARLLPENQTHLSTKFAGTLGYTAPEYAIHGQLSEKVDTYSYGVVVLEIISGTKNSGMIIDPNGEFLLKRAWNLYEHGNHIELVDKTLESSDYEVEEMKKIIEVALMCTQSLPASRPTMSEIVVQLKSHKNNYVNHDHLPVSRPAFIDNAADFRPRVHRQTGDTSTSTTSSSSGSNANASITQLSGR